MQFRFNLPAKDREDDTLADDEDAVPLLLLLHMEADRAALVLPAPLTCAIARTDRFCAEASTLNIKTFSTVGKKTDVHFKLEGKILTVLP